MAEHAVRPRRQVIRLYFGSVRFFKNLILLAVCVLVAVPTVFAFKYRQEAAALRASQDALAESGTPEAGLIFEPELSPDDAAAESEALSADTPDYQSLYPDFYAPQPYAATERAENVIYLTFDDGPSERTDEILDVLSEKDVKATFFVIGKEDEADLERMRRIVAGGHTIGMHSYSHKYEAVYASVESFLEDFYRNFSQIRDATGVTPTVFRFPGGSINGYDGGIYQELISEMIRRGFVPYDWNISSEDAATNRIIPAETLKQNVAAGAEGKIRGFVLFHDSVQKVTTPAALGPTVDTLREMGFDFSAITPGTLPVLYHYPG